ncbi:hypothetical protein ACJX0J_019135, partial [Zea mays]
NNAKIMPLTEVSLWFTAIKYFWMYISLLYISLLVNLVLHTFHGQEAMYNLCYIGDILLDTEGHCLIVIIGFEQDICDIISFFLHIFIYLEGYIQDMHGAA